MARRPAARRPRDSRAFNVKVGVRCEALDLLGADVERPRVLDLFAGTGKVWQAIAETRPLDVTSVEIDPAKAAPGAIIADNVDVLRTFDISHFDLIDCDAYGWPDEQLELIAWRRRAQLPVVTVTLNAALYTVVPNRVKNAAGLPTTWPEGAITFGWQQWWNHYAASLGWISSRRWIGRRGGAAYSCYEILVPPPPAALVPPDAAAETPRAADRRGRARSRSALQPTA
jgi:SAM-dependent methyltransferase